MNVPKSARIPDVVGQEEPYALSHDSTRRQRDVAIQLPLEGRGHLAGL